MHFCVAILILKMEENIFGILCFIISRKVKMQLKRKKSFVYGEGAVTDQTCQKWFAKNHWRFVLEISHWTILHGGVDQLKLIKIKSKQ